MDDDKERLQRRGNDPLWQEMGRLSPGQIACLPTKRLIAIAICAQTDIMADLNEVFEEIGEE